MAGKTDADPQSAVAPSIFEADPPHEDEVTDAMVLQGGPGGQGEMEEGEDVPPDTGQSGPQDPPADGIQVGSRTFANGQERDQYYQELETRFENTQTQFLGLQTQLNTLQGQARTPAADPATAATGAAEVAGIDLEVEAERIANLDRTEDDSKVVFKEILGLAEKIASAQKPGISREEVAGIIRESKTAEAVESREWDDLFVAHPELREHKPLVRMIVSGIEGRDLIGLTPVQERQLIFDKAEAHAKSMGGTLAKRGRRQRDPNRPTNVITTRQAVAEGGSSRPGGQTSTTPKPPSTLTQEVRGMQSRIKGVSGALAE